ncbi:MAG TPA: hypothetical protein VIN12_09755 [Candidatus Dormibacteraeota bacterium]|jgi:hypothetical protein
MLNDLGVKTVSQDYIFLCVRPPGRSAKGLYALAWRRVTDSAEDVARRDLGKLRDFS